MNLYYLTVEGITSTVFESQVRGLLNNLEERGWEVNLLIGQKYRSRIPIFKLLSLLSKKRVKFIFYKSKINHEINAKIILDKLPKSSPTILHCRNVEAAYVGLLIKEKAKQPIQIIYDVRGFVEQEKAYFNEPQREKLFRSFNNKLFKADIYYSFVSTELYEVYNEKYKIPYKKVIFCNSGYNDSIFTTPQKSDYDGNTLIKILFVGGNQTYQKTEEIVSVLKDKEGVELTVITPKPLRIKSLNNNVILLSNQSQNEINEIADKFDYGIIYRSSEPFNQVATPTKVSEYLGKGLKVIAINSAGSYSKMLLENKTLGHLVKTESELKTLKLKKTTYSEKIIISDYAKKNLSLSKNVENYIGLYKKINGSF